MAGGSNWSRRAAALPDSFAGDVLRGCTRCQLRYILVHGGQALVPPSAAQADARRRQTALHVREGELIRVRW